LLTILLVSCEYWCDFCSGTYYLNDEISCQWTKNGVSCENHYDLFDRKGIATGGQTFGVFKNIIIFKKIVISW